jgi:hypothetical protein
MSVLSAKAAADAIRADMQFCLAHDANPKLRHAHTFAADVAKHLGLEPNHATVEHILQLLDKHDIGSEVGTEYPKWVDGRIVLSAPEAEVKAPPKKSVPKPN